MSEKVTKLSFSGTVCNKENMIFTMIIFKMDIMVVKGYAICIWIGVVKSDLEQNIKSSQSQYPILN